MVPNGWEIKTLDAAKVVVTDGDRGKEYPKSSDFSEDGYCLFLSAKNVTKRGFSFSEKQFISKDKHEKLRKGLVNRGDIVLTTRGTVGQFSFYDESITYEPIRINSGMVTLNFINADIKNDFFYALSKSSIIKKQIDLAAFGSAQPQLTVKIIKSLKLPVPPFPEQRKIATILGTWDKAISTTERLIDKSKQQKKALMQQLLTGKKRLLDDSGKPFEAKWEDVLLGNIVDRPICYGVLKPGDHTEGGIPLLRIQDLKGSLLNESQMIRITEELHQEFKRTILREGDLVMSIVGTLGKVLKIPKQLEGANITRAFAVIGIAEHSTDFIKQYLTSDYIQEWLLNTATGNAQKVLNVAAIKKLKISVPAIKEQRKIAIALGNADKEIELFEQQLADLKQEKKALMQQLLTGKRRVKI